MKLSQVLSSALTLATLALVAPSALAQDTNKAAAIAAFDDAQAFVERGDLASACPKFAESYRLDPQLGTLLNVGLCLEQQGKLASAWAAFREAAEVAEKRGDSRSVDAAARASAIKPKLMQLQLQLPADFPADAKITRNGAVVDPSQWKSAVYLDPGNYTLEVSAPGKQGWRTTVTMKDEGKLVAVAVPALVAGAAEPTSDGKAPQGEEPSVLEQKWPALVAGGVAVAGGAVWAIFGIQSMNNKAASNENGLCDAATNVCTAEGEALRQQALQNGDIATVGMIVTGVGLVAGTVLWITLPWGDSGAPSDASASAQADRLAPRARLGVGPGSLQLVGSF